MGFAAELEGVSHRYGSTAALAGVTLQIPAGCMAGLIGPDGVGKSSLLALVSGVRKLQAGKVTVLGQDMAQAAARQATAPRIAYMPQGLGRNLYPTLTVQENLELGGFSRRRAGESRAALANTMEEVFALFPRLKERLPQLAGTLSGGERQMLAVGRALMGKPKLLLLDEPSLGLAPLITRDILHTISRLRESGLSVLLIEQNARAALQTADYGYVLETGELSLEGEADRLLHDERVIATYLGRH